MGNKVVAKIARAINTYLHITHTAIIASYDNLFFLVFTFRTIYHEIDILVCFGICFFRSFFFTHLLLILHFCWMCIKIGSTTNKARQQKKCNIFFVLLSFLHKKSFFFLPFDIIWQPEISKNTLRMNTIMYSENSNNNISND